MRRPQKRVRAKVRVRKLVERLPTRAPIAQHFTLYPDPAMPHVVQVFISPDNRHMRQVAYFKDGIDQFCRFTRGAVRTFTSQITKKPAIRPGLVVSRMFLNKRDLLKGATEIASHECGHAAMAWSRFRRANLKQMEGEEVMCYALGRMHSQLITILWQCGVFK